MLTGNVFITGGAGFLGRGILQRAKEENWPCDITIFSRDEVKHSRIMREYPDVRCIRGDVSGDLDYLTSAMMGHDIVIHAAATKVIPVAEHNPIQTFQDNTFGSINVAYAACQAGVQDILGISTDKVCHPVNAYGLSKYAMEYVFQEAQTWGYPTDFHLVRYGNVLDSTASVLTLWYRQIQEEGLLRITNPDMTRFWLTIDKAVDLVLLALGQEPGTITVPLLPALRMGDMAEYVYPGAKQLVISERPGEKKHEELLTLEETPFTVHFDLHDYVVLYPSTSRPSPENLRYQGEYYTSANPKRWIERDELLEMI